MRKSFIPIVYAVLPLLLAAGAQTARAVDQRTPVTSELVAQALTHAGLVCTEAQVTLPAGLSTSGDHPDLQLLSAERLVTGILRVRLACKQTGSCQPFFALLTPGVSQDILKSDHTAHPGAIAQGPDRAPQERVLAGQRVTLLLEDAHMRITMPAIAIDTGAAGTEVRVSSLDRKHTYQAVVAADDVVRGVLP